MSNGELDDYTLNRIRWKKRDIDDLVAGTRFQVVLEYELFSLERQFSEAIA